MAENTRTSDQRERDLLTIEEMYLTGHTQAAIAEEIGVCRSQVAYDLKDIRQRWQDARLKVRDDMVDQELRKLDRLETEHWEAWEVSQESKTRTMQETRKRGGVETKQTDGTCLIEGGKIIERRGQKITEQRNGDPRHLDAIRVIVADRRKLLGLDPPTKIAPTDPSGENPYSGMGAEELKALAAQVCGGEEKAEADGES